MSSNAHRVLILAVGLALSSASFTAFSAESTAATASSSATAASQSETFAEKVPANLLHLGVTSKYYSPYAFVVDKQERMLHVWAQENGGYKEIAKFPADLGRKDGDKKSSGDARTPEGVYFLQQHLSGPGLEFSLYGNRAFTTDYPNFFDRREGKTGHGIWLHAVPDKVPLTRGSRGCVVVRNNVIDELKQYVSLRKTPILIENHVELRAASEIETESQALAQVLEGWRSSWEKKDLENYIGYYADDFKALRMNRDQWKKFKSGLNTKYQQISVRLSRPLLLRDRDHVIARFVQHYTSDQHSDVGEKTIYLKKIDGNFKIIGEEWSADTSVTANEELNAGTLATSSTPRTTAAQ